MQNETVTAEWNVDNRKRGLNPYLKLSYNYLKDLGISLSDEELLEMRNGTRLYLLPNTLNTEELEVMKAYLQESVTVKPGDLQTNFTEIRNLCSRLPTVSINIYLVRFHFLWYN